MLVKKRSKMYFWLAYKDDIWFVNDDIRYKDKRYGVSESTKSLGIEILHI